MYTVYTLRRDYSITFLFLWYFIKLEKKAEMSIPETFRNGTIFVTGCTGFMGKVLTEKLLRSCDVKNIAVLVRGKNGLDASQRAGDIFKQSVSIFLFLIIIMIIVDKFNILLLSNL